MEKTEKIKSEKKRQTTNHGAMEKCRAVLAVWTERRRPAEICRELGVPWMVLSEWQKRAMEGMLQALEPRVSLDKGPALSPRLQAMLEKKRLTPPAQGRLEKTLLSDSEDKELARKRAAVVFAVRSGQITAEEGARRLGVSRKTYYEWEKRALQAMTEAMEDKAPGRPSTPQDEEKRRLQDEITELRNKLFVAEKTVEVRDMLHAYELQKAKEKKGMLEEKKQKRRKKP
jgi:transposase-like protein